MGGFRCVLGCFLVGLDFGCVSWPFFGVGGGWVACCFALVGGVGGAVVVCFGVQFFGAWVRGGASNGVLIVEFPKASGGARSVARYGKINLAVLG